MLSLQKYRLHRTRPGNLIHKQAAQYLVMGGIWAPPHEHDAAMATITTSATCNRIHAPIASRPQFLQRLQDKQFHSIDRASHTDDRVHSQSSANSSTHTTTNSPGY